MAIAVGNTGIYRIVVPTEHTADALGNTGVHVLATPMLGLYCEMACHVAIRDDFAPGQSSVGTHLDIHHLAATPVGEEVTVTATITEIDRRRIVFAVVGVDSRGPVVRGLHERFLVDLEAFLAKLPGRATS